MEIKHQCLVDYLIYFPANYNNLLEFSNKVILDKTLLESLLNENINYLDNGPIIFKIKNTTEFGIFESYVGVHEFSALDNKIYLPNIIAENLFAEKDMVIDIEYYLPPKGTFLKLKPTSDNFYKIDNIKDFLETAIIKDYPVLEMGKIINIKNNDDVISLEIVKTEPFDIISTFNTDLEVDFCPIDKIEKIKTPSISSDDLKEEHNNGKVIGGNTAENVEDIRKARLKRFCKNNKKI